MIEYYVLTADKHFKQVVYWLHDRNVALEVHLNRTRFRLDPDSKLHTEFCLMWANACGQVDASLDLATGLPLTASE